MNAENNPVCVIMFVLLGAGWFFTRYTNAESRSARLGALSATVGVAAFGPALVGGSGIRDPAAADALAISGYVTLTMAVVALGLAVAAYRVRLRRPPAFGPRTARS